VTNSKRSVGCFVCGAETKVSTVGRPRMYCSSACKQRAYRARAATPDGPSAADAALQATSAVTTLAAELTFLEVVLLTRYGSQMDLSAHGLAKDILGHARELVRATMALEPPPPRAPLGETAPVADRNGDSDASGLIA